MSVRRTKLLGEIPWWTTQGSRFTPPRHVEHLSALHQIIERTINLCVFKSASYSSTPQLAHNAEEPRSLSVPHAPLLHRIRRNPYATLNFLSL